MGAVFCFGSDGMGLRSASLPIGLILWGISAILLGNSAGSFSDSRY